MANDLGEIIYLGTAEVTACSIFWLTEENRKTSTLETSREGNSLNIR